ncbi:MAG: 1-deoxy-D-xylulose-5-phosphate reductoisomerase [Zymomonas mobilis subsp. pomaceae]|uniref:1-deoxy-D-xylulose 5-phosphate reductoisomerase n=1 Tax=Zymomonas mobilis subsp. pomaceae (strain ATCC 29192 / DSM 22645 / JCM 10191 / CCUG 17912 / NBRC 13757 / NCIMB 11200 / NRRL B-4491 / Barker I) TaxID=579138 RepID=F8ETP1_ZYMMT|nr:1-deoxy-D-xylulose-5-phosphate reductoisomerase [Zymomonas mobilis]AEI37051.1 1-deoxy-D-xylulose 5-phosphate reductoisomerase [Zymomonas mobilis subsp. pomaceae ATCC 29192]MDX5948423.1 1-deoxy-D-xylulose-5-phosphate reductoisomerase [Zymomonas mobilis subsp. pomaceae]GEB89587.1 1-deoxy-D-xylulose 5-phosphate reductoisomerase [Zymomonas mobilis subsp. pomaceae]
MNQPRTVTVLGATGSIGHSTLDLIERNPDRYQVMALTAHRNVKELAAAAKRTKAKRAVIADESLYSALKEALAGTDVEAAAGPTALVEAAAMGADWTMAAIIGCAGLKPTLAAIRAGKTVALANKEALVSAGALMIEAVKNHGTILLPVDSEHNAIFQCFPHNNPEYVRRIIITASGGPFRKTPLEDMAKVTPEQAVRHPNWSMGAKISVDSATMMNKGLELIEAYHLFKVPLDTFEILVHPQSVIHSMVEYRDGSILAQIGSPDMRTPIGHTLAWPKRMETPSESLDFAKLRQMDFEAPDYQRFPALSLAVHSLKAGGPRPAVMNAANEIAVAAFLERKIGFLDIAKIVEKTLEYYTPPAPSSLEDVFAIDSEARLQAMNLMESLPA